MIKFKFLLTHLVTFLLISALLTACGRVGDPTPPNGEPDLSTQPYPQY